MEQRVAVNLSVKNVPDDLAQKLRERAQRNRRSLQRELLSILEGAAADTRGGQAARGWEATAPEEGKLPIEEIAARARQIFPRPTKGESATAIIRRMRDGRYGDRWLKTGRQVD